MDAAMIDYEFDVWCNDVHVSSAVSHDRAEALKEAQHYVTQYSEDGPCEIWEVIRRKVWPE